MSTSAPRQQHEPVAQHQPATADMPASRTATPLPHAWADGPRQLRQSEHIAQFQSAAESATPAAASTAQGGLPEGLRNGIESLSGMDMSGVRVHRNSGKPAQLNAHAYAQGQDIHLAPGQEQHLPHEAWHVVQQAQGRVKPTMQMAGGVAVNDDGGLEREADLMGGRAVQLTGGKRQDLTPNPRVRMTAQRHAIAATYGATAQLNKTQHAFGDLHYGISTPRYDGFTNMQEESTGSKADDPENPVSVDELNDNAKVTEKLQDVDTTKGYFAAMTMISSYSPPSTPKKAERWLSFLKQEQNYLKLDGLVTQIQTTTAPSRPSKDKLNKNGPAPTGSLTSIGKRDAIVTAYAAKETAAAPLDYRPLVNDWVWDAFFRRTSKLGIDFTLAEGKVVHFNMRAPGNPLKSRLESKVNVDAEPTKLSGRQPITHSEIRYVNRKGLVGHSQVDIYGHENEVNNPRTVDEGKVPNYP